MYVCACVCVCVCLGRSEWSLRVQFRSTRAGLQDFRASGLMFLTDGAQLLVVEQFLLD